MVAPSGTGTVDVTATTPNGTSALNAPSDQYTYNAPPTVTSVSPNNGPPSGTNTVTVNGTGFVSGSTTVDFGTSAGTSVSVGGSGDSLSVVVPAGSGTVSVTVITTSGGSSAPLADAYTYNAPPTVTGVSPNNGPQAGTNTVTVTGTGFVPGSTTVDFGTSNPGSAVVVGGSGDSLTVVAPSGTGTVDVTATTPNGTSALNAPSDQYTYNAPPTVTSVSPNNGPPSGTNTVTVNGTGFVSGSTTVDFGTSAGTSVSVGGSGDSLSVVVPAGSGTVSVTVITTSGGSSAPLADAYTYNAPPTVTGVSPNNGPQAGTNTVTVTGTGFVPGSTTVDFGTSNPGSAVVVSGSGDSLTVVAPSGTGTVDVTATTPNGTSALNAPSDQYTYDAPPTVTSVSPNNGPPSGTNTVTVNGTGFVSGSTTVDFGTSAGTSVSVGWLGRLAQRGRPGGFGHGLGDRDHHQWWVLGPAGRRLHLQRFDRARRHGCSRQINRVDRELPREGVGHRLGSRHDRHTE